MAASIRFAMLALSVLAAVSCEGTRTPTPTAPDITPATMSGNWIGQSRVVSCDGPAVVCGQHPRGHGRFLAFHLSEQRDALGGNLTITEGGPLALPFPFAIAATVGSARRFTFTSAIDPNHPSSIDFAGDAVVSGASPARMTGQMTERGSSLGESYLIVWETDVVHR